MKLQIKKGSTDVTIYLFIQDSSSTTGAGLTGLVYNSASLICYYVRPLGSATQLSLATQTVTGAHSDGGFVEVSSSNMPGVYRLDLSDAIVASGVNSATLLLKGATNMAQLPVEIELVAYDPQDAASLGISRIDAAITSRASQTSVDTVDDFLDTEIAAIKAKTDNLPSDPADASLVAGLIAAVETKVDTVDTVVDSIKVTTDKLDDTLEDDAGTYRFTENSLEEAPSGGGSAPTAEEIASEVWDTKVDDHLSDRSFGMKIGVHIPFTVPDIDYKRIRKVVKEEVEAIPAPVVNEPDLIPISEGLQAILTEVRGIDIPQREKLNLEPVLKQLEASVKDIKQVIQDKEIPETDLTSVLKTLNEIERGVVMIEDSQEDIKEAQLVTVRKLVEDGINKLTETMGQVKDSLDNTQMVVLQDKPKQEAKKPDVLDEYLNLPQ